MASRHELRRTFRPVVIHGDPRALRAAAKRGHLRLVGSEYETPAPGRLRRTLYGGLSDGQMALLVLGAIAAGALAGWWWRKQRESAAKPKSRDLLGLDVIVSAS